MIELRQQYSKLGIDGVSLGVESRTRLNRLELVSAGFKVNFDRNDMLTEKLSK